MSGDQSRPFDDLADQLTRIESTLDDVLKESRITNGRLTKLEAERLPTLEDTLFGPDEERRREHDPGLVAKVAQVRRLAFDLAGARDEAQAVKGARTEIRAIGLTVAGLMLTTLAIVVAIWLGV